MKTNEVIAEKPKFTTKDREFWVEDDENNDSTNRVIVYVKFFAPLFEKASGDISDETLEQVRTSSSANVEKWLPTIRDMASFETVFSDEEKDKYLFMKTLTRTPNTTNLEGVYEKAIGRSWDPQLKAIMQSLSMEKVSEPRGVRDYLIQNSVNELNEMHGWKVIKWRADSKDINLGGRLGVKNLVCDTVVWQRELDGIIVTTSSELGWRPY